MGVSTQYLPWAQYWPCFPLHNAASDRLTFMRTIIYRDGQNYIIIQQILYCNHVIFSCYTSRRQPNLMLLWLQSERLALRGVRLSKYGWQVDEFWWRYWLLWLGSSMKSQLICFPITTYTVMWRYNKRKRSTFYTNNPSWLPFHNHNEFNYFSIDYYCFLFNILYQENRLAVIALLPGVNYQ